MQLPPDNSEPQRKPGETPSEVASNASEGPRALGHLTNSSSALERISLHDAVAGGVTERATYERLRPWSYEALPERVREECYSIAKTRYQEVVRDSVIQMFRECVETSDGVLDAASRFFQGQVGINIRRVFEAHSKCFPKDGAAWVVTPPRHIVTDLGFDRYESLSGLRGGEMPTTPMVEDWRTLMRVVFNQSQALARFAKFLGSGTRVSIEDLHFRRDYPGALGAAARRAFGEITEYLIAHQLCVDLLADIRVELSPEALHTLANEVKREPWSDLSSSTRLASIREYQRRIQEGEWRPCSLSEGVIYSDYAFNRIPFEVMQDRDARPSELLTRDSEQSVIVENARDYGRPVHEVKRAALEKVIESYESESGVSIAPHAKRAMVGQCLKKNVGSEVLREKLREIRDGELIVRALRELARHDGTSPGLEANSGVESADSPSDSEPTEPFVRPRVDIRFIEPKGRPSVSQWLRTLKRSEREKMEKLLSKLGEGRSDIAKPVSGRPPTGGAALFEIKDSSGLSIYLRYIPGGVAVLLHAGTKSSREGDLRIAAELARTLNGLKEGDPIPLPSISARGRE